MTEYSVAQLSQRQSNPSNYSTGTRPLAGDLGVFLALDVFDLENILDDIQGNEDPEDELEVPNFSLVNAKYYFSNDLVFRVGIVAAKDKSVTRGDIYFPAGTAAQPGDVTSVIQRNSERDYALKPGVEKHFNPSNLIDMYVGGEALIGVHRTVNQNEQEFNGGSSINNVVGSSLLYGAGAFIGMQFFVADLPLAIGLEYGIIGKGYALKRYKVTTEQVAAGVTTSDEFFVAPDDDPNNPATLYESLNSRTFDLDNQVRVTLSYFFSN